MKPDRNHLVFSVFSRGSAFKTRLVEGTSIEDQIRQSLLFILSTECGERPLNPKYGTDLKTFLFRRNTESLLSEIETHVREKISEHENRVSLDEVAAEWTEEKASQVDIVIRYRIKSTELKQTLRFPMGLMS